MPEDTKNKFKGEFAKVPISQVKPNEWNPKESIEDNAENKRRFEEIKKGIVELSLYAPIIVRELGPGVYEIIDGFHRWKACGDLGYDEIIIWNLGHMTKEEAQAITLKSIYQNIPASEPMTAQIVAAINITNPEALKLLPFNDIQIQEYLELAHFDFDNYKDENLGSGGKPPEEKEVECPQCHHKFIPQTWQNPQATPISEEGENPANQPITENPDQEQS